jgi:ABC-type sugar transport system permease subunit
MIAQPPLWTRPQRRAPYLFLLPEIAVLGIFFFWPLWQSLTLSFHVTAGTHARRFVGLDNYRFLILHDRLFWLAVINTIAYTSAFLLVQIPASLGLAMLLNRRDVRGKSIFRFCFFSTYLVGQVFMAVIFFALLGRETNVGWLTRPALALPATLLAGWSLSIGYAMIYFLAALQTVDENLREAAVLDGAGTWAVFWNVILPGVKPVLIFLVVVGTIWGFQLFELPYVLFQGPGPNYRALTIVMYLYSTAFERGDLGYSAAIGWLLVLLLSGVSILQLKFTSALAEP